MTSPLPLGNTSVREQLRALRGECSSLLFAGPASLGKTMTAEWYAALLNCAAAADEPCGQCSSCRKIKSRNHPDVLMLERDPARQSIGVGEVREGIAAAGYRPFEGRYRIWILAEAERLTEEAQNCLLKTLEEPPPRLVVMVVCSCPGSLLPTVTSRCRPFHFRPVEPGELSRFLISRGAEPDRASTLARLSQGCPGKALEMLEDPQLWERREAILDVLQGLPGSGLWNGIQSAVQLESSKLGRSEGRGNVEHVLEVVMSWYRDLAHVAAGGPEAEVLNMHRLEMLRRQAGREPRRYTGCLRRVLEAQEHLQLNVNTRLLMQRLCICLVREG